MDESMELEAMKARFVRKVLTEVQNKDLLEKLSAYLQKKLEKSATSPCRYSVEEAKQMLQESEERYRQGEYITNEDAMKNMDQWL